MGEPAASGRRSVDIDAALARHAARVRATGACGVSRAEDRRRRDRGLCPVHGTAMAQIGVLPAGIEVGCTRKTCDFTMAVLPGMPAWDARP